MTIQNGSFNPNGPAGDAPVGYLLGSNAVDLYDGPAHWDSAPFTPVWSGNGSDRLAHNFGFVVPANQTYAMAYFVHRGLAERVPGPEGCLANCVTPGTGSQVALVTGTMSAMAAGPPLCDLRANLRAVIINWPPAPRRPILGASHDHAYLPLPPAALAGRARRLWPGLFGLGAASGGVPARAHCT